MNKLHAFHLMASIAALQSTGKLLDEIPGPRSTGPFRKRKPSRIPRKAGARRSVRRRQRNR